MNVRKYTCAGIDRVGRPETQQGGRAPQRQCIRRNHRGPFPDEIPSPQGRFSPVFACVHMLWTGHWSKKVSVNTGWSFKHNWVALQSRCLKQGKKFSDCSIVLGFSNRSTLYRPMFDAGKLQMTILDPLRKKYICYKEWGPGDSWKICDQLRMYKKCPQK